MPKMQWWVTRQFPCYGGGDPYIEITNDRDNISPDALSKEYSGEFTSHETAVLAVEVGISILTQWKIDRPELNIGIAIGDTLGASCGMEVETDVDKVREIAKNIDNQKE